MISTAPLKKAIKCGLLPQPGQSGRLLSPFSGTAPLLCQLTGIHSVSLLKRTALPLISAGIFLLMLSLLEASRKTRK